MRLQSELWLGVIRSFTAAVCCTGTEASEFALLTTSNRPWTRLRTEARTANELFDRMCQDPSKLASTSTIIALNQDQHSQRIPLANSARCARVKISKAGKPAQPTSHCHAFLQHRVQHMAAAFPVLPSMRNLQNSLSKEWLSTVLR